MRNNKKILIVALVMTLIVVIGGSFAIINYVDITSNQSVVAGNIYMKYTNGKEIVLNSLTPRDTYDENSYFEFKVEGNNDSTKDIWYDVVLSYGDKVNGRTERIKDYLLKFRLVEIINGKEKVVVDNQSYSDLKNRRIYVNTIKANGAENVDITYRLYMWVASGLILVGNTEDAIYDIDTWNNQVFASINVSVTGDFSEKEVPLTATQIVLNSIENHTTDSCTPTVTDDNGTPEDESDDTIYFSGTNDCVNFNYIWYSGKLWRIVAINPDGSMKLVTQDSITAIWWGADITYKDSWIREWLNEDFKNTLYNYQNVIIQKANWNATLDGNDIPLRPPTDENAAIVNGDVGLLNAYEYYQSYKNTNCEDGYLKGYWWWLITPYNNSNVRHVTDKGYLRSNNPSSSTNGVRPSINLKSNIRIVSGEGTLENPYRINGDKENGNSGELINTRISGEYVKIDNKVYRIVGIENGTTKLTSVDYVRNNSSVMTKKFGSTTSWADSVASGNNDYWGYYLNNTWLTQELKKYITDGTYYLKQTDVSSSFKNAICSTKNTTEPTSSCLKTTSTWTGLVGLPRIGEMFSSQLGKGPSLSSIIWLITPRDNSNAWHVNIGGSLGTPSLGDYGVRPSINLKSEVIITGGDGMSEETAYTIGL